MKKTNLLAIFVVIFFSHFSLVKNQGYQQPFSRLPVSPRRKVINNFSTGHAPTSLSRRNHHFSYTYLPLLFTFVPSLFLTKKQKRRNTATNSMLP